MQKPSLVLAATTLILLACTSARADVNATAEMCNGCHGENGVSQWNDVPIIAGIDAFVHSDALYVYRDEARPCAMSEFRAGDMTRSAIDMCNVVKEMSDDEIDAIAEYYAALPFVPAKQDFDPALAAAGEAVHLSECRAGQWMGYLETTFAEYASGAREQPDKMKEKMDALSDEDTIALLHYYASQQ